MSDEEEQIAILQALFDSPLPPPVANWLRIGKPRVAGGLPLLGLPVGPDLGNAWGATQYLRATRPELEPRYLVIRLLGERALGVDVFAGDRQCPLGLIDCNTADPPVGLNTTFEDYLDEAAVNDEVANRVFNRIEQILASEGHNYDHVKGGKLPRAHEWRLVRSCVHDRLVGAAALRQVAETDTTEIDLFETADHPLYEKGHAVRSLLALAFADAYKAGSSMRMLFTKVTGIRRSVVPEEVVDFARSQRIPLHLRPDNVLEHDEGELLFAAAVGLSSRTVQTILQKEELRLDSIAYLAATRIWTPEEIEWLLNSASSPASVLFGECDQRHWLAFSSALSWARASVLVSAFRAALNDGGQEGVEGTALGVHGTHFELTLARPIPQIWSLGDSDRFDAGTKIAVLPLPQLPFELETDLLVARAKIFAKERADCPQKVILRTGECINTCKTDELEELRKLGVALAYLPFSLNDLDALVEERFARARRVRR